MRYLTSILRWLVCGLLMLVWYPPLILASFVVPMSRLHGPARLAFRLTMRVLGLKLVVRGLEHIDPARSYLYVGNHVNLFDPFVFVSGVPQWVVAVEKRPNFKIPVYGWLIGRWGNIPIERDDPEAARETLQEVVRRLQAGESICLMPEGTRSRDGEVGAFKSGPFQVAIEAGTRVLPFALRNMDKFNRTGSFLVQPAEVELVFTPAIDAGEYDMKGLRSLLKRARAQTIEALE